MNFGDVLNEWEGMKREERVHKSVAPSPASAPAKTAVPERTRANEDFIAYMNRYGVGDKDAELDREEAEERRMRAETGRLVKMRPEAAIDLHGLTETDALLRLDLFLEDSRRSGLRKILIVHGKGLHSDSEPVLARAVARFLERHPAAGRTGRAEKRDGGSGATWVVLRERRA